MDVPRNVSFSSFAFSHFQTLLRSYISLPFLSLTHFPGEKFLQNLPFIFSIFQWSHFWLIPFHFHISLIHSLFDSDPHKKKGEKEKSFLTKATNAFILFIFSCFSFLPPFFLLPHFLALHIIHPILMRKTKYRQCHSMRTKGMKEKRGKKADDETNVSFLNLFQDSFHSLSKIPSTLSKIPPPTSQLNGINFTIFHSLKCVKKAFLGRLVERDCEWGGERERKRSKYDETSKGEVQNFCNISSCSHCLDSSQCSLFRDEERVEMMMMMIVGAISCRLTFLFHFSLIFPFSWLLDISVQSSHSMCNDYSETCNRSTRNFMISSQLSIPFFSFLPFLTFILFTCNFCPTNHTFCFNGCSPRVRTDHQRRLFAFKLHLL